ncbi:hypothetical protein JCM15457_191 [Liquorilactobacillus sucicola DSM 21376 = JCM 15457]|uniref:Cysteine desulfurase n=1 Tax=Liquorilactobacillus sucicola DSM 21376 = JCM 15457 TaxID=1423806 RepID=A0A023CUR9_9LACO|nr:DUF1831 domain-containing protein [Liquorilactobacillus sucicola]KRN05270.1 hypothetical protein FD15_GL001817 [Liquorilactobacillus sucicola DSM 21376 = JCM 15457]GAJ25331.1 hypothetical protein JCM15457_191 [Liquorilactobacillus sucicola DSM 21376 = JCM 15457]
MAYAKQLKIKGDKRTYKLSTDIKKYTLRDIGFVESKNGKFQLERSLEPNSPFNQGLKFKLAIAPDLQTFKMLTTSANGLNEINIYKSAEAATRIEQLNYILELLEQRHVLQKVENL